MSVFSLCLPTVTPTEDPVPSCGVDTVITVIMAVVISILVLAVLILGVVTGVLCHRKGRTGACYVCGSGCSAADAKSQVWQLQNPEEIRGPELHKDPPTIVTVPSNPSPPSGTSIHVKTSSTSAYPTKPCSTDTCGTNSGSSGSPSQSRPRKHSRKRSDIAGEQGVDLLSEGDDDAFHDQ